MSAARVAVVTGASRGLGKAFAEACARRGWDLALASLPGEGLAAVAGSIAANYGVEARWLEADLADEGARNAFADLAVEGGRRVGLLVNNAGFSRHGYFDLMPPDIPRRILETNILSTVGLTGELVPDLERCARESGSPSMIITVSSLSALRAMPLMAVYAASKSFLMEFGLALRRELGPLGIRSTVLCPGGVLTNPEVRRRIAAQGLGGRLSAMGADEVAEAALAGAERDKAIVVPGPFNKALRALSFLLPRDAHAAYAHSRLKRAFATGAAGVDSAYFDDR